MPRLVLTFAILLLLLGACGPTAIVPSPQPTQAPASPSTPPQGSAPPASPEPTTPSPAPTVEPASPTPLAFTPEEQRLLDGIRRNAVDCVPLRDDLPAGAVGGIECASDDPAVARIGFFSFPDDATMLAAYFARMQAEGIEQDSGGCNDAEGESAYIPGEGLLADRNGCFVNAEGFGNYRATISGSHVYIGVLGRTADLGDLVDFAWRGNQDVPGNPTLWSEPGA